MGGEAGNLSMLGGRLVDMELLVGLGISWGLRYPGKDT